MSSTRLVNVAVSRDTRERLRQYGHTPDSFDMIVRRILDKIETAGGAAKSNK